MTRYRLAEREQFDPGPCPTCGVAGAFTVDWVPASTGAEEPGEYAVPGLVTCLYRRVGTHTYQRIE